jgi:Leucine-rich repeat (LRR) protein
VSVLQHLTVLDLSDNRLSGLIRQEILTLPLVERLNISNNQFTEMEPMPYPREGLQLRVLDAHANRLHGHLPISLVNIANLSSIDLSHNLFSGRIPLEYGAKLGSSWKSLLLEDNFLIGNLPPQFINGTVAVRANFAHNCLRCPPNIPFCRGGQRANTECVEQQDHSTWEVTDNSQRFIIKIPCTRAYNKVQWGKLPLPNQWFQRRRRCHNLYSSLMHFKCWTNVHLSIG